MADRSGTASSPSATKPSSRMGSQELAFSQPRDEWGGTDGNELIFAWDEEEEGAVVGLPESLSPCKEALPAGPILRGAPSPPDSDFSPASFPPQSSAGLVQPQGPKPLINLVKSLSTEIESREGASLRPQPLLSLVKSISTEISRLEPEVTQSKSDSKLNVHRWRQITHPKGKNGDSRTAPSSPSTSPLEGKGSFFKAQEAKFEDTKRRFSEAMQEPLSRLSRIIGDENSPSSPKAKPGPPGNHVLEAPASLRRDSPAPEAKSEGHGSPQGALWGQPSRRSQGEEGPPAGQKWGPSSNCRYEICSYGDVIQVVEVAPEKGPGEDEVRTVRPLEVLCPTQPRGTVPGKALACIALLAYNYFVLPLPPYVSGLLLGLAGGFMLGFLIIFLLVPKRSLARRETQPRWGKMPWEVLNRQPQQEPDGLKGWMNEMYFYDPELYHPSLTHSVFVTLEDSSVKLSYPKSNIPRRATFDEEIADVAFVSHHQYDLRGAKVFLFPPGLARKRMWNKKYPVCVLLPESDDPASKGSAEHDADPPKEQSAKKRQPPGQDTPPKLPEDPRERTLYLFGRTGREKEEWFQHLTRASQAKGHEPPNAGQSETRAGANQLSPSGRGTRSSSSSSRGSTEDLPSLAKPKDLAGNVREKLLLDYNMYMSRTVPAANNPSSPESPCPGAAGSLTPKKSLGDDSIGSEPQTAWVNAVLGRMFWDFLREKYWADQVSDKVQKKLGRIKLPYFMNELTLTELDMGTSIPHVAGISSPTVDPRGLWVDLEVTYSGPLQMTLETKMNLCKLGKEALAEENGKVDPGGEGIQPRLVLLADSDAESSSAGSSEEEELPAVEPSGVPGDRNIPPGAEGHVVGNSTSRKILRLVDKIAKSKYFQKATENEFIKKKIEEVSNTPLLLTVEVQELTGTLTVNIPPPPTDRVWYSFKTPPQLDLKVRPKLGEREVTFIHVTEWIEKKLQHEFQKILVMPNMDDLILPLMHSVSEAPMPAEEAPEDCLGESEREC